MNGENVGMTLGVIVRFDDNDCVTLGVILLVCRAEVLGLFDTVNEFVIEGELQADIDNEFNGDDVVITLDDDSKVTDACCVKV